MNFWEHKKWSEKYELDLLDYDNAQPGTLEGFDCPKCKNKGVRHTLVKSNVSGCLDRVAVPCECMTRRNQHD